ncbi:MAG: transposase [Xanthomonadales bacterium]|nr:transposase [Xanthomonadales bacterium]
MDTLVNFQRAEPRFPGQFSTSANNLAIRHRNFLPFLVEPYEAVRRLLLNCLEIIDLQALDDDSETRKLIQILRDLRSSRKRLLTFEEVGLEKTELKWLSELWRYHVIQKGEDGTDCLYRVYFELAILFKIRSELKSGDLYVPKGERFDDYRESLVDDETLVKELPDYGATTGIDVDAQQHIAKLIEQLKQKIRQVDARFPDNPYAEIVDGRLSLKRPKRSKTSQDVQLLDDMITERMTPANIVDVLIDTCRWLNLHTEFRTISEGRGRIAELLPRVVTTLLCYGCNLGPVQTERSVRAISRKQVSWINHQYVKEDTLNRCIVKAINRYTSYRLPGFWGSGKTASADGTKWRLYEQNLISERHIRYGGYGGIGYYHVSDNYIALMSFFTTCGTYEAIHILDGLLANKSDVQPDTVHGDTQAQSLPVFALAHLLGIKLMPRIRQLIDLVFSRAEPKHKCEHIEALFKDDIDWKLIETNFLEMLRVAVSIKLGVITSSSILRRLGTHSRKNPLYFAFRELGKVIRTLFMLEYVDDLEVRKMIQAATNKSEQFNRFVKWVFFGGEGIIAENIRHEQSKLVKYSHLVANLIILHNVNEMTRVIGELQQEGMTFTDEVLGGLSPYRMGHINRFGDYTVDVSRSPVKTFADSDMRMPVAA